MTNKYINNIIMVKDVSWMTQLSCLANLVFSVKALYKFFLLRKSLTYLLLKPFSIFANLLRK